MAGDHGLMDAAARWETWHAAVAQLREQNATLLDCLTAAGLLRTETFLAQLHKRRFAAARRTHPCVWRSSLTDVLEPSGGMALPTVGVSLPLASFAGMPSARALQGASRAFSDAVGTALDIFGDRFCKLYVCGGFNGEHSMKSAELFNPATERWEAMAPLINARWDAAAATISGRLYICGGHNNHRMLTSAERYDPLTGAWEQLPPMAQSRRVASAVVIAGCVYLCGGHDGQRTLNWAECFNPQTSTWETLPPMVRRRGFAAATFVASKLYVCGGFDDDQAIRTTERFDPVAATWEALPPMRQRRGFAAAAVVSGQLYICGGHDGQQVLNTVERFDPAVGTWEPVPPMRHARAFTNASVISGQLYLCGGFDGRTALGSAERYDPDTGRWELLPPMAHPRYAAVVTTFSSMFEERLTPPTEHATFIIWDEDGGAAEVSAPVTATIEQLLWIVRQASSVRLKIREDASAWALHAEAVGSQELVPLNRPVPPHMFADVREKRRAAIVGVRGAYFESGTDHKIQRRISRACALLDDLNSIVGSEEFQAEVQSLEDNENGIADLAVWVHRLVLERHGLKPHEVSVMQSRIGLVVYGSREVERRTNVLANLSLTSS